MFRYGSPIYFATLAHFKNKLFASTVSLSDLKARKKLAGNQKDVLIEVTEVNEVTVAVDCDINSKVIDAQYSQDSAKAKDGLPEGQNDGKLALMPQPVDGNLGSVMKQGEACDIKNIIMECSAVPFIDTSGCMMLAQLHGEYNKHGIKFILAGCCDDVVSTLKRVEQCNTLCKDAVYPSVQSAVLCLHSNLY